MIGTLDTEGDINKALKDLANMIILNDNGNKAEFEPLDLIEYEGEEFIVLLTVEDSNAAGEVVILKVENTDNLAEEGYISIDDNDTLNAVFAIFKDKR